MVHASLLQGNRRALLWDVTCLLVVVDLVPHTCIILIWLILPYGGQWQRTWVWKSRRDKRFRRLDVLICYGLWCRCACMWVALDGTCESHQQNGTLEHVNAWMYVHEQISVAECACKTSKRLIIIDFSIGSRMANHLLPLRNVDFYDGCWPLTLSPQGPPLQ